MTWIPSHSGIEGNERVDEAAKEAILEGDITEITTHYDLNNRFKKKIKQKWKTKWHQSGTKLSVIDHTTVITPPVTELRKDLIILRRLRIGHAYFTHNYLLNRESPPMCPTCDTQMTVQHLITECKQYQPQRIQCMVSNKLEEALNISKPECLNTLNYIKALNLRI